MFLAQRQALAVAEARATAAEADARERALLIEKLKHTIAQLRHERFGQSSERRALLDQLELQLFELEEDQAQSEAAAPINEPPTQTVQAFTRRKPSRRPLPEHLPRERVVYPMPSACPCCGGALHKLGEDVTETLELVPRQWKVIQHVREKHSCRSCEKITQPPAPSHPIARGREQARRLNASFRAGSTLQLILPRPSPDAYADALIRLRLKEQGLELPHLVVGATPDNQIVVRSNGDPDVMRSFGRT